ncbi:MAG: FmdB family zinc ribbon protein [bacterium]
MPTYDYQCKKCKHEFEVFHKMSETPDIHCPKCNSKAERLISYNPNVIFKGEGFYVNDYKKKEQRASQKNTETNTCADCTKNKSED